MHRQIIEFKVIYCPTPHCPNHLIKTKRIQRQNFVRIGFFRRISGQMVQRFRCRKCGTALSENIASMDYRNKKRRLNPKIFDMFVDGLSNRQIARRLNVDETLVRNRLWKLAKQSFLIQSEKTKKLKISEVISYDGVENFAKSQYEPNNINHAIGMNSYFIYDFNFSPLNRKGRMSDRQKLNDAKLQKSLGRFSRDAVRASTNLIFSRLNDRRAPGSALCIASDQHYQYRRSVEIDLRHYGINITHKTISSKAPRVYKHILFAVNHSDLLLRQHIKAFSRETISFSKTHAAMVQKYALFMIWKNYMRAQFTKKHKVNPKSNVQSPAMAIGLEKKVLVFKELFRIRKNISQILVHAEWRNYFNSVVPNLRQLPSSRTHFPLHN